MTSADVVLVLHASAGAAGLALGPQALTATVAGNLRLGDRARAAYQVAVTAVCASAVLLAAMALTWLIPVALVTHPLAIVGARAERRAWRAHGLGGSYLALVTALLVVSWSSPLAWVLPSALGLPLILHAAHGRRRWRPVAG